MAQIPTLVHANPAHVTNAEWNTYSGLVVAYATQVKADIQQIAATLQVEAEPQAYTDNLMTPTTKIAASAAVTGWLHHMQAQHTALVAAEAARVAQTNAIATTVTNTVAAANAAATAQPGAAPAPVPQAQVPANVTALLNMVNQLLGQQMAAPVIPPPPAQPHYKAALPTKYTRVISESRGFLNKCKNYFVLNPMNNEQRIRFTLQLMEGDADHWAATALDVFQQPQPPNWMLNWVLFKTHFNQHFADAQEQERAHQLLLNRKLFQTTSIRKFADLVVNTCQKAGWNNPTQWKAILHNGMKPEIAKLMASHITLHWNDYLPLAISIDKEVQCLKGHKNKPKKSNNTNASSASTSKDTNRSENYKFKLSNAERKEHLKGGLCFKCHKKGHNSTECKGTRTVYKDVKGKAQVANVETTEKGEEDFVKSD